MTNRGLASRRWIAPAAAVLVTLLAGGTIATCVHEHRARRLARAREIAARPQATPAPPQPSLRPPEWTAKFRALIEANRWDDLDALLDELEDRAPVLYRSQRLGYLHARAAQAAGDEQEAERRLQPYLVKGEPWRPLALWHLAEIAAAAGRDGEASVMRHTLLVEHPESLYWQRALDAQLEAVTKRGDPSATLALVAELAALPMEDRSARELAAARVAALLAQHEAATARGEGLAVLARSTHDDAAERVAVLLDKPSLLRGMSGPQLAAMAESMLHHRRWDQAIELYLLARRALPARQRGGIDFMMGRARFFAERYTDALRLYRRAATNAASKADQARALFHAGRAAQLLHHDQEAETLWTAAIAVPGRFDSTSAALTSRLRLRVQKKRLADAAADLALLHRFFPRDDSVLQGTVALAMGQIAAGQPATARVTLGILPASLGDADRAETTYWRGRATEAKDPQEAVAEYLAVLRAPVATHFAYLARHRLAQPALAATVAALVAERRKEARDALAGGDLVRARDLATDVALLAGTPADLQALANVYRQIPEYRDVLELRPLDLPVLPLPDDAAPDQRLMAMGLFDETAGDIASRFPVEPLRSGLTRAYAYRLAGASRASIGGAEAMMRQVPDDFVPQLLPRLAREMLYPRYFYDTIVAEAKRFDADPRLLLSIMREESRFNPRAKSAAAARGLMQLLLSTARKVAVGIGVAPVQPEDLYDPDVVIELGAKYVGDLQAQLGGDPYATAAAYNAGPNQAKLWLRQAPAPGHDFYLSTIGFAETKDYVRKVLNSYERYGEIYEGTAPVGGTRAEP